MDDVDLSDFTAPRKGPPCSVGLGIDRLKDAELAKVKAALVAAHITNVMIATRLSEWSGVDTNPQSVGRHRNKKCACSG